MNDMPTDNQRDLLTLLQTVSPEGASIRFLDNTEPDARGGELHRVLIEYAKDTISLRIPRAFVEDHEAGSANDRRELEKRLGEFVTDKFQSLVANPGPRLRPVITWTFASES